MPQPRLPQKRPPDSEAKIKVTLYITETQRRTFKVRAAEAGLSMSDLLGRWLDGDLIELHKIGSVTVDTSKGSSR